MACVTAIADTIWETVFSGVRCGVSPIRVLRSESAQCYSCLVALVTKGSGTRSVLFVHGSPGDHTSMLPVAERAPQGVRVGLLDLPGHGAAAAEPSSVADCEAAVLDAVAQMPGELVLVGHSFGGYLCASVSDRLPQRCVRIVGVAAVGALSKDAFDMRRALLAQVVAGNETPESLRELCLGLFLGSTRAPQYEAVLEPCLTLSAERWKRVLERVLELESRPDVRLHRPGVCIHGTRDVAVPVDTGRALAQISGATMQEVDTDSHMLTLTHPDFVASHVFASP